MAGRSCRQKICTYTRIDDNKTPPVYSSFRNNFVKTILRHGSEKESLKVEFDQTGTPPMPSTCRSYNENMSGVSEIRLQ